MLATIKIFVVQDDPSLSARLHVTPKAYDTVLDVIGVETDYSSAHQAIKRSLPNVVALNKRSGLIHFLQIVHSSMSSVNSLAFVSSQEDATALWLAGATGLCSSDVDKCDLESAIYSVAQGHSWIECSIAQRMRQGSNGHEKNSVAAQKNGTPYIGCSAPLSERELSVLKLLAGGARNREIANELYTSVSTIKSDIARILMKLGVEDRIEAAVYATRHQLI